MSDHIYFIDHKWEEIQKVLMNQGSLGVIYLHILNLSQVEFTYGSEHYEHLLGQLKERILALKGKVLRKEDILTVYQSEGDAFLIFLSEKRQAEQLARQDLESISDRIFAHLNAEVVALLYPYLAAQAEFTIGYAMALKNPLVSSRRLIYRLISDAREMANYQRYRWEIKSRERLKMIIAEEKLRTHFQPIVSLSQKKVIGYEALSRGPQKTEYEQPQMLFPLAQKNNLLFELDRVCRNRAIEDCERMPVGTKLFLNTHPSAIHDPEFRDIASLPVLEQSPLRPTDVVLELTEKMAIQNYELFRDTMRYYTDRGFCMAVDDVGAGYSSLEVLAELQPTYIKYDLSLVQGVHKSRHKQAILKSLTAVSMELNIQVIAEGVEMLDDLKALIDLGIDLCQGFIIARPQPGFADINFDNILSSW